MLAASRITPVTPLSCGGFPSCFDPCTPGPCTCPQPSPPQVATFNFTGTPAKVLRMWLPYASPDTEMVVVLNLLGVNSRWGSHLGVEPLCRAA